MYLVQIQNGFSQPSLSSYDDIRLYEVTQGIYVARWPNVIRGTNSIIILDSAWVTVVDTGYTPRLARAIINQIKSITDKHVKYVINTHWHGDHVQGNQEFVNSFPDVEIIAHISTYKEMVTEGVEEAGNYKDNLPRIIASYKRSAERRINTEVGDFFQMIALDAEILLEESESISITPPTLTFSEQMNIGNSSREIQILHLGKGNTKGDAIVFLPNEKVLIAGDVVVHPTPYGFGSHPKEWIEVLKKIKEMDFDYLIPGHGKVLIEKDYIALLIEIIEYILPKVDLAVEQGLSLKETKEAVDLTVFEERITCGNELKKYIFKYWLCIINYAYNESTSK